MTRRSPKKLLLLRLAKSLARRTSDHYSTNATHLSRLLARLLSLAKSLTVKTLNSTILFMGDDSDWLNDEAHSGFNNNTSIIQLDSPAASSSSPSFNYGLFSNGNRLYDDDDDDDAGELQKLYLVRYRWLEEVELGRSIGGVLYEAGSMEEADGGGKTIVLMLREVLLAADEQIDGDEYALIPGTMWLRALRRYNDMKGAAEELNKSSVAEGHLPDIFPLQIRLSFSRQTNSLLVKISQEENKETSYRRACNIFIPGSTAHWLHIWDFSGQIREDCMNKPNDSPGISEKEITLQLQLFTDSVSGGDTDDIEMSDSFETCIDVHSVKMNETSDTSRGVGCLGLRGLRNLGNTCFMNSAIQCLGHTPKLVDYFLGDYRKDINYENQLGMKGELALAFGDLLCKLWTPGENPVAPRKFKRTLATYALQFSGYNQHDAQEFLAFLLDGLHEDLNRVKLKPYIEVKDADGRPHKEVAEEHWQNHLARNISIIIDLCLGQFRSTLVCPACKMSSVIFDPFMYLSLPLPSTRVMTLTVLSSFGDTLPCPVTITVPKCGRLKDLTEALGTACSLKDDETLLVAEIFMNKIRHFFNDPCVLLAMIRDGDKLVAYRLPKGFEAFPLLTFIHQEAEKYCRYGSTTSNNRCFGIPLVGSLSVVPNKANIHRLYLQLLKPFLMPADDGLENYDLDTIGNEDSAMEDSLSPRSSDSLSHRSSDSLSPRSSDKNGSSACEIEDHNQSNSNFRFYFEDRYHPVEILMGTELSIPKCNSTPTVFAVWSEKMTEKYDTCLLKSSPVVFKHQFLSWRPEESITLYDCLEAFLKEEPLGPEDMWYCPNCKKHQQARKKLDFWRLPEVLVVHLKRFSHSRYSQNKLETFVDFPVDDLDLSEYITHRESLVSNRYTLYAISNHIGGMGGGHYTAYVNNGQQWYEFDDSMVSPVSKDSIKTASAYFLFYRRVA